MSYKTWDPTYNPAPSQSSCWTPHCLHMTWDTPVQGVTQAQLDPNQEKGHLKPLMLIQATQKWNQHHAFTQPCTKEWKSVKGMWLGLLLQGALFAGRAGHRDGEGKRCKRSGALLLLEGKPMSERGMLQVWRMLVKCWLDSDPSQVTHMLKHWAQNSTVKWSEVKIT